MYIFHYFLAVLALRRFADCSNATDHAITEIADNKTTTAREEDCPLVADKDIFELVFSNNYSKLARPHLNASEPMEVTVAFRLYGIQDFMERESIISLDAYLDLSWTDDYLQWNNSWPHNCIDNIVLPTETIWLADVVLLNSPDNPNFVATSTGLKIYVSKTGEVLFSSIGRLQMICELELQYFPFDRQICPIHFEAWSYPSSKEHLTHNGVSNISIIEQLWTENQQWRLIGNYTQIGVTLYPDDSYDKIVYFLILERKSLFFYVNVIIPSLVIAIVELVTFFLPLTEVVKVHISFTCLLAYSVFQSMVIAELPRTSASTPLLCLYIDLQMSFIALALLIEGVVFYLAENSAKKKPIPDSLLKIAIITGRLLLIHSEPICKGRPKKAANPRRPKTLKLSQQYFDLIPKKYDQNYSTSSLPPEQPSNRNRAKNAKERQEWWLFIGEVVERINFLTYLLLISITPGIMFGVMPYYQPDIYEKLQRDYIK